MSSNHAAAHRKNNDPMDIRIYVGPFRTASHHIYKVIEENADMIAEQKIKIVTPEKQLPALKKATDAISAGATPEDARQEFLEKLCGKSDPEKLVILDHRLCGTVTRPVSRAFLLPQSGLSLARLVNLLPQGEFRFFIATRNLATYLPSCYSTSLTNAKVETYEEFLNDAEIHKIRWSDTLGRIVKRQEMADENNKNLVVWKYEDYPKIWRDVVQAITGIENGPDLVGDAHPVNQGLSLYGCRLMHEYLQKHAPKELGDFRKVKRAFLEKFQSATDVTSDSEWDQEIIENLTYAYEDDWYYIERMENLETLQPRPTY